MVREIFLVLALASPLAALEQGGQTQPSDQQSPQVPSSNDKDLCSYLKDVEAKTDADCGQEALTALKSQDPVAYSQKLELAWKRKPEILKAYEFLKARPSPDQPAPTQLQPPINERTFPAWLGAEAKDLKEVHSRWLQAQNQELQREKETPVSLKRRREIDAALTANQSKITALWKINDPAEFRCFLGEGCGIKSEMSDPSVRGTGTGQGGWTKADYQRANAEAGGQTRILGGKIDRGVPTFGLVASEVVANTPLGPLAQKPADGTHSGLGTVATMALATAGALLLFGGLEGKMLEKKLPNIRRNMGIAPLMLSTPQLTERARNAVASAESPQGQRLLVQAEQQLPQSVRQGALLKEHLRQLEKYGEAGYKVLEDGRIRYYDPTSPATAKGMDAWRRVREWDPVTGMKRTWFETLAAAGRQRIIRPETGGEKIHYYFDEAGNYVGKR